jgi:PAS domain S-box-containing protein
MNSKNPRLTRHVIKLGNRVQWWTASVLGLAALLCALLAYLHVQALQRLTLVLQYMDSSRQVEIDLAVVNWALFIGVILFIGIGVGVYRAEHNRRDAEVRGKVSEARYRAIVEDQTELICRYDQNFRLLFVNDAYAQFFLMRPEELIGQSFIDRIPPAERERAIAHVRSLTARNPVATSEHLSVMPDHTLRWIQWTDRVLLDDAGNMIEYQGVGRDITARKQAEKSLVERGQASIEAILHHSPDAILLLDRDLLIQQANRQVYAIFGCTKDEILGKSLRNFIPAESAETLKNFVHDTREKQGGKQVELTAVREDGTPFDAEVSIGEIQGDGLVCVVRDISERKAHERQLQYHASLQESVSDAVFVMDMAFTLQSWNKAAEQIYAGVWRKGAKS